MANPTTNYGFVLPTSTDLVTDLPADFDVALQGVDTRLKALQPGTTLGDIAYSSATANTNTRLAIGSTSQVLTVAGGVPTWATPSSGGGMTLLSTTGLSGASTTVSISATGYKQLSIGISGITATGNGALRMALNGSTNLTDTAMNYWGTTGASVGDLNWYWGSYIAMLGSNANNAFQINVYEPALTTQYKNLDYVGGFLDSGSQAYAIQGGGVYKSNSAISSAVFTVFGGSFTGGTVLVYGVK